MRCKIYDTTLRDGLQEYGREISINDAVKFAKKLDEMGFSWLEAGFASAGEDQMARIKKLASLKLKNVTVTAFGRTRGKRESCETAVDLNAILESGVKSAALVGKVRLRDIVNSLETDEATNLAMIRESVEYLKKKRLEVIFDAEHFFDGLKDDRKVTLRAIKAADKAGADWIVLCDTNGASTPTFIKEGISLASNVVKMKKLGFHGHNDRGRAITNTETACESGVNHLQGTINGYGERCGNTDLSVLIPNLVFDHGKQSINKNSLKKLSNLSFETSLFVGAEPRSNHPWVGSRAGYTEAGMHTSGIMRDKFSYIHADLSLVGNKMTYGVSDQSGKSSLAIKAKELGFDLTKTEIKNLAKLHDQKIKAGFVFSGAEASFYLLILESLKEKTPINNLILKNWHVDTYTEGRDISTKAKICLSFNNKETTLCSFGTGPVDAISKALTKITRKICPTLTHFKLADYNVKIVNPKAAASAKVRVLVESRDNKKSWCTVGVHENIIEASIIALLDSLKYAIAQNN